MQEDPSAHALRTRAEQRLAQRQEASSAYDAPNDPRLVHELEIHQIELEMQNDELSRASHDIERARKRYAELFAFAPLGYVVLDPDGVVTEANHEIARVLRMPRGEIVGKRLALWVEPTERRAFEQFTGDAMREGESGRKTFEVTLLAEPDVLRVRLVATTHDGERDLLLAVDDVTARWRAETALNEENRRKDDFMAALAHELRNPLSPISSSIAVLERVEPDSAAAQKAMAAMKRQVGHLAHIVDDLLDATRVARGKMRLERAPLELASLVRQTTDDHDEEFRAKNITLTRRLADDVWVAADHTRLVQLVGNLLSNALKFTQPGGSVEVLLRRGEGQAVLSVRDDGIGIAPEIRPQLFAAFMQAPQTLDRTRGGLGLGLALVKGFAELHDGKATVASEGLGRGSTFEVTLPLTSAPAAPSTRESLPPRLSRVLVVDDNIDSADALQQLLQLDGHDVRVAYDGTTALSLARELRPDVIVCDIGLPDIDGYALARALRQGEATRGTYLIALSGYARAEDRARSAEAGFDCHLSKPPDLDELGRAVARKPARP